MSYCSLRGKTIFVTGASSGIGMQAALQAARQGASVFITGRNSEKLEETFDALPGEGHSMMACALTDGAGRPALVNELPELPGLTPAKYIRQEDIDRMLGINYRVPVLLTAAILQRKKLHNNASVVLMSSIVTRSPYFGGTLYAGAKGAIETYTKTLALELVDRGIRVNCLSPGLVSTPLINDPAKESNPAIVEDSMQRYLAKYPMGVGEAEDVANAIIFLLADESRWISGANIDMGAVMR